MLSQQALCLGLTLKTSTHRLEGSTGPGVTACLLTLPMSHDSFLIASCTAMVDTLLGCLQSTQGEYLVRSGKSFLLWFQGSCVRLSR